MVKREQIAEELKKQQPAQEAEKDTVYCTDPLSIRAVMKEIRSYCQHARKWLEQAAELQQSGRNDF